MSSLRMILNVGRIGPVCSSLSRKTTTIITYPTCSHRSIWSSFVGSKEAPAAEQAPSHAEPPSAPPSGNAEEPEIPGQVDDLMKALQEMKESRDEFIDKYKRALAENENIRNRLMKQIEDAKVYGIQKFCRDLLEVADVLGKATECVPKEEISNANPHLKNLYEGLTMTETVLKGVFNRHGVKVIDPINEKFNPNFHEAMFEQEVKDKPSGTIVVVTKTGYMLNERVIRPALVGVSK